MSENGASHYYGLKRIRKEAVRQDRGVLGRSGLSRMDIQRSSKNWLNSSQGKPYEACICQRRKRHESGNSSIQLFLLALVPLFFLGAGFLTMPARAERASQDEQIRQTGDAFEAMMLTRMQESMEKSQGMLEPGESNPFAPSHAEMIYRGMLREHVMKDMAKRRPLGIGNLVERQLRGQIGIGRRSALVESK